MAVCVSNIQGCLKNNWTIRLEVMAKILFKTSYIIVNNLEPKSNFLLESAVVENNQMA